MKQLRLALFDLDDTLVDHTYGVKAALSGVSSVRSELSGYTPDELAKLWGVTFWKYWAKVVTGEISLHQSRVFRFIDLFTAIGSSLETSEGEKIAAEYGKIYISSIKLIEDAWNLLEHINSIGVDIGIVTNTTKDMVDEKISRTGISRFVHFAICAEDIGKMKPDVEIFKMALERSGCEPENAVFTGDSVTSDVVGARNAGIAPVWFNRFGRTWTEDSFRVPILESYRPVESAYLTISQAVNSR